MRDCADNRDDRRFLMAFRTFESASRSAPCIEDQCYDSISVFYQIMRLLFDNIPVFISILISCCLKNTSGRVANQVSV